MRTTSARRGTLALTLLLAASPSEASSPLGRVRVVPDTAISIGGVLFTPQQIVDDRGGVFTVISIGTLPRGVNIDAHSLDANGENLFSLDSAATLGALTVERGDVVRYRRGSYSLVFDASTSGIPSGANLDAYARFDGVDYLSFDTTLSLGGIVAGPGDLVRFSGGTFTMFFDGSVQGFRPGTNLDGAELRPNGHLLLSFDTSGTIGPITFHDEDVLEYTPAGALWELAYDGSARSAGWNGADLAAFAARGINGDVNDSGSLTLPDLFYLANFLFAAGPSPSGVSDTNNDGSTTSADLFVLVRYFFTGGPAPD